MRIGVCVVGRLRAGPERTLVDGYHKRFEVTGKPLGLGPLKLIEVEDKRNQGMAGEAKLLEKNIPAGSVICVLDERGKVMSSPEFAHQVSGWQDQGRSEVTFVIGGADGIDPNLQKKADFHLSFGKMVWPHMLARVMLFEQLYRAASILANKPYHRV